MIRRSFDASNKGIPFTGGDASGWNVFGEDTTLPAAVILGSVLERNSAAMADYCHRNGVSLAPHGKTTMSPELFELQMRDGAWAITAANVHQARVIPRLRLAISSLRPASLSAYN